MPDLPLHMRADDPAAADPARRRLLQTSTFPRFPYLPSLPSQKRPSLIPSPVLPSDDIIIDDPPLPAQHDDLYCWAVLYENQRGITLFSTPFYSPLSLLPFDPQPFTTPDSLNSPQHPNLSLENYPLPDGTWRWVSTAWMIDMRSDLGEVQPDGFEYNWRFRDNHWHAKIGTLGSGAWVRRRRWVKLMMRPAIHSHPHTTPLSCRPPPTSSLSLLSHHHVSHTWDGSEQDWQHVHRLLKQLGRDGRKLELWRIWLGPFVHAHASDIKGKTKLSDMPSLKALESRLSDVVTEGNTPTPVHLATLLQNHGEDVIHSFVFPDSRAQFVHLVSQAGLAEDLERSLGHPFSAAEVDFWSYTETKDSL